MLSPRELSMSVTSKNPIFLKTNMPNRATGLLSTAVLVPRSDLNTLRHLPPFYVRASQPISHKNHTAIEPGPARRCSCSRVIELTRNLPHLASNRGLPGARRLYSRRTIRKNAASHGGGYNLSALQLLNPTTTRRPEHTAPHTPC